MIVLTPEESRALDERTIRAGIASETLKQRAAKAVFDVLNRQFQLSRQSVLSVNGKGNNGDDGRIVERLLSEAGATIDRERATVVIDAVLGTGLRGPAHGEALEQIRWINAQRPRAKIVSIDVPSGLGSGGEHVIADITVAIGTLKPVHVLPPWCDACGEIQVVDIGLLPAESKLHQTDPPRFSARRRDSHKGDYGHVLVVGGAPGKAGAAAMAGLAALRSGAGWVTVTAPTPYPELMTAPLDAPPFEGKTVIAIGPGLGLDHVSMVRDLYAHSPLPIVVDADALNSLAGWTLHAAKSLF